MKIEIDDTIREKYHINFQKVINYLIKIIPQEHIMDLEKIWLTDSHFKKESKSAYGFYYGKREGADVPTIIINVTNVFSGIPKFIFYCFPLIPKLFIAHTLYHEVAHHYQRLRHGITKEKWEADAKTYSRKMMLKRFGFAIRILRLAFRPVSSLKKGDKEG